VAVPPGLVAVVVLPLIRLFWIAGSSPGAGNMPTAPMTTATFGLLTVAVLPWKVTFVIVKSPSPSNAAGPDGPTSSVDPVCAVTELPRNSLFFSESRTSPHVQ
jgi:hypothetical protein